MTATIRLVEDNAEDPPSSSSQPSHWYAGQNDDDRYISRKYLPSSATIQSVRTVKNALTSCPELDIQSRFSKPPTIPKFNSSVSLCSQTLQEVKKGLSVHDLYSSSSRGFSTSSRDSEGERDEL